MPVELPEVEPSGDAPKPPRAIVWLGVFVVVMLVGVVVALLTWPNGEPTNTVWFWVRLLVFPALAWCALFGLRLHYYDEATQRRQAQHDVRADDRAKALLFASEPLAVLGCTYLTAPGSAHVAAKIANGELVLTAETSPAGTDAVRHTALAFQESSKLPERYRACFGALLERIAGSVAAIPSKVPLSVHLHLPTDVDQESLLNLWQSCWTAKGLRPMKAKLLGAAPGVMILDEWLDIRGGPSLEKASLIVSVQLHDAPPQSSAEAAVGVLLAWAPLAERCAFKTLALLHRPVEVGADGLDGAISKALLWGKTSANDARDLWQVGLYKSDKGALLQAASDTKLAVSQTDGFTGVHDVDLAIGNPGICAGWLAIALGVEHAVQIGVQQLIAWHEGTPRLAVIRASRA
ncbi:hypothetical protein DPV79_36285 [Burkholderia reimsis]|uniref:Uncharacterized protein n=1 Tax=Burkholderia reimsis TaxID=2234132 RepID=A0A365QIK4_9BURK|nr:hypothetical protein [Burkholderia reimsis]RBB33091.1 hypothetical protein DPV79_36285 [Burkholderia reimsis]